MARSEKIYDAPIPEKNELVKYLNEIRVAGFQEWVAWLPLEVMGAVMEKTATMVDTLGFYEGLDREELFPEQKLFVHQRWLKVKNKQIERLQLDVNKSDDSERSRISRNWNVRKRELEDKLEEWRMDKKAVEILPEFPAIKVDADEEFARKVQVDWQSPACRIAIGTDAQIMVNVKDGSLVAFPADVVDSKKQAGKINFHSDKLPISGEIVTGKSMKIFVNGKLLKEFTLE